MSVRHIVQQESVFVFFLGKGFTQQILQKNLKENTTQG